MEVKPIHIVAASVFAFLAIVAANLLVDRRSNTMLREKFSGIDFSSIRKQRVAEEQMTATEVTEAE